MEKSFETDFLDKDYERKINYLNQQFTRMWTRFNFFVVIESALLGGKLLINTPSDKPDKLMYSGFGMLISVCWYIFGANDKYLVQVYRDAVEKASDKLKTHLNLPDYHYVGQVDEEGTSFPNVKMGLFSWRIKSYSITYLAAIFPFVLFLFWLTYFCVNLYCQWPLKICC